MCRVKTEGYKKRLIESKLRWTPVPKEEMAVGASTERDRCSPRTESLGIIGTDRHSRYESLQVR